MRRRLLLVLLAFSVLAVAGFAVPLLGSTAANRTYEFAVARTADAARLAALAQPVLAGGPADQLRAEVRAHAAVFGDGVVVVDARRQVVAAEGMTAADPAAAAAIDAALRNQPRPPPADLRPWSAGEVLFSQAVGTGVRVSGAVVLRTSVRPAAQDIAWRWAVVLLASLIAAAAVVVLVFRLASWVLLPVDRLAAAMHRMIRGSERAHVDIVAGPPELRGLAEEFNHMSDALAESAERQRALVADIAHQLRNPMAALRLRVDGLADGAAQRSMQIEFDRLEALLDGMLALATADSTATDLAASGAATDLAASGMATDLAASGTSTGLAASGTVTGLFAAGGATNLSASSPEARCDAIAVLTERLDAWHDAATRSAVSFTAQPDPPTALPVRCTESDLAQIIDVLLDNAVKYAGPGATVTWSAGARGGAALLRIADNGPGVAADDLPRLTERFWRGADTPGSGLGLAIAERLLTARGGALDITPTEPTGLTVTIALPGGSS